VHVADVAKTFRAAISATSGTPGVHRFLVGESDPVTYAQIHETAAHAFLGREIPLLRVPKLFAKSGAWLTARLAAVRGNRTFIQPWMIDFAGEHFEFDLTHSRKQLGWSPTRFLGDHLDTMCERAAAYRDIWLEKNRARPW
jgi:nucleoside-diphosphate-sugar epimerase